MDSAEFVEWIADYRLSPWGEERADMRMGILASVIANSQRAKGVKSYKPADFIPEYGRATKPVDTRQQIALMRLFTRAAGGTIH